MKGRIEVYVGADTEVALREYARRHRDRFPSVSGAAAHLLERALVAGLDEGVDALLAPVLVAAVRAVVTREIADGMRPLLERQSERLAGLLVGSGKDAHCAARLAEVALGQLLGDPARAARVAEEAGLQAGARYRLRERSPGPPPFPPPGRSARPPGTGE